MATVGKIRTCNYDVFSTQRLSNDDIDLHRKGRNEETRHENAERKKKKKRRKRCFWHEQNRKREDETFMRVMHRGKNKTKQNTRGGSGGHEMGTAHARWRA